MTRAAQAGMVATWRVVNISPSERAGRIAFGLAAAIAGIALLVGASSVLAIVLAAALVLVGLDMIITGATGHCPLYQRLGRAPRPVKSLR